MLNVPSEKSNNITFATEKFRKDAWYPHELWLLCSMLTSFMIQLYQTLLKDTLFW